MPIIVNCFVCNKKVKKSPSKIRNRPCCSRKCQIKLASKDILEIGKPYRITPERRKKIWEKTLQGLHENSGQKNYKWKGEKVSYRGLHYWVRRKKGNPTKCSKCGRESTKPRIIQWANIDGKYRRNLDDFIALCVSCHKIFDAKVRY